MLHFDKVLKQTRTKKQPYLIEPFMEQTVVGSMQPNEENLPPNKFYNYTETGFPEKLN